MFTTITKIFDSSIIYHKTYTVFTYYMYLIPVFFVLALGMRLMEESVKNIGEEANYDKAFQDAFTTAILIFSYGAVACVVCQLIIAINNYAGSQGSFSVILNEYNDIIDGMTKTTTIEKLLNLAGFQLELFAGGCFTLTFSLLMFVHLFLKFAYAVLFCFLFTWGGIAIATSPSQVFSLKGGFIATLKGLMIWPIVESIFYVLVYLLIAQAGDNIAAMITPATKTGGVVVTYFIFSFINIFLIAVIVAAALVSFYLSQNQSAMAGVAAPFIAAGVGTSAMVTKLTKKGASFGLQKAMSPGRGLGGAAGRQFANTGVGNIISTQSANINSILKKDNSPSTSNDSGTVGNIMSADSKKKD